MAINRVVLDTTAYSHAMRGTETAAAAIREAPEILISPVVIGELLAGSERGSRRAQNEKQLREFIARERVRVIQISQITATHYSSILNILRNEGKPIPTNDIWIAACAMEHGAVVTTTDVHFSYVKGLLVDLLRE